MDRPARIVVIGAAGSGKTTLAQRLAHTTDAAFVDLDALNWKPAWVQSDHEEFVAKARDATRGDHWIVAGNYRRVAQDAAIWSRAEMIVWLDLPLPVLLLRLCRRTYRRLRTHELLWGTNYENLSQHLRFWEARNNNLFAFTVRTFAQRRREYTAEMYDPRWQHVRWVRLRTPAQVAAFAQALEHTTRR